GAYQSVQDPVTLLKAGVFESNLTFVQQQRLQLAMLFDADRTWNAGTHTATLTWYRRNATDFTAADKTKPVMTKTTVYASDNVQVVSQTAAVVAGNLN